MTQTWPQQPAPQQPPMVPDSQRRDGMLIHLWALGAMVLSAGTLGLIVSIVLLVLWKDRGPFVRQHAANAVNIQIVTLVLLFVSGILMFVLIGFITYPIVLVWSFVLHVRGAAKANRGLPYSPMLTPRILR